ncbi:hypothetical protein [Streptomyces synnematoformans]|uniref:DUF11 domain-containing protein n=1 Tax=Streptomyces synnematoformans TaxID=415721 RepID=A0ABN2YJZ2_9ACTN
MTTSLRPRSPRSPHGFRGARGLRGNGIPGGVRAAALACALLAAAAQPAGAAPRPLDDDKGKDVQGVSGPAMKIAIDNARKTSGPGQEATYTIRVASLQDRPIRGIEVRHMLPDGLELVEPGEGGRLRGREVVWTANLKGHKHSEFTARTRMAETASTQGNLVATACAYKKGANVPVVCAPDIDKLTDEPARTGDDGRNSDGGQRAAEDSERGLGYGLGAGALLLGGGAAVFALRRRAAARRRG